VTAVGAVAAGEPATEGGHAEPVNRIAVRLPNWLGDTVMAVPALVAVRARWPQARVLAAGPWAPLLAHQGLVDVLADYPRTWRGRLRAADTVSAFAPELAILLPNSLESALAAWYWGARRRVGFAGGGRSLLLTDAVPMAAQRSHQIDEYLVLVGRCGASAATREPVLRPPDADSDMLAEARRLLEEAGVPPRRASRRIAVHLGAAYGSAKLWPLERVTEFCRLLVAEGATAILLGAPSDAAAAATITAAAPALSLVGRDRPLLLPALLAQIDVLVAGDTGVAHLAAALGTPVVTLFGPTDPRLSAPRGRASVVTHPVPCAPCFYRTCPIEHPCLRGVEPADVYKRALSMVEARAADLGEASP
jgi:lipopolysaccharide heptosyltransferase II